MRVDNEDAWSGRVTKGVKFREMVEDTAKEISSDYDGEYQDEKLAEDIDRGSWWLCASRITRELTRIYSQRGYLRCWQTGSFDGSFQTSGRGC